MQSKYIKIDSAYYIYAEYEDSTSDGGDFYEYADPAKAIAKMESLLADGATNVSAKLYSRADLGTQFNRPDGYYDLNAWCGMTPTVVAKMPGADVSYSIVAPVGYPREITEDQALAALLG